MTPLREWTAAEIVEIMTFDALIDAGWPFESAISAARGSKSNKCRTRRKTAEELAAERVCAAQDAEVEMKTAYKSPDPKERDRARARVYYWRHREEVLAKSQAKRDKEAAANAPKT